MIFNDHSNLEGKHSFLSPSKVTWLNYTRDELYATYLRSFAPQIGTELHALAKDLITFRMKVSKGDRHMLWVPLLKAKIPKEAIDMDWIFPNFMAYVNDAISYRMTPEVPLVYSWAAFGTADTISFEDNFLRIHDYKSGVTPAKIEQLEIYAALFCLEYRQNPLDIHSELRIYQGGEVLVHNPEAAEIMDICNVIRESSGIIENIKKG